MKRQILDIVELTAKDDERFWVPDTAPNCWMRPLMFDLTSGNHVEILRVRKGGILGRHLHPTPVHGFVLDGSLNYLDHDWVAETSGYFPGSKLPLKAKVMMS